MSQTNPRLRYLIFYITSRCNLQCEHCFYSDELNQLEEMPIEEIERVAQSLRPLDFLRVTGGEPFLRHDLPQALHAFHTLAETKRMGIITNGSKPEWVEKAVVQLFELAPRLQVDIGVSIDGLEPVHDEIRRRAGSFQSAKKTVETLLACKKNFPGLTASLVVTVTSRNEPHLDALFDELSKWGVDRISVNHARGKTNDESLLKVDFSHYERFAQRCEANHLERARHWKAGVQRAKNRLTRKAIAKVVSGEKWDMTCQAGRSIGVLYSDGNVALCEMLDGELPPKDGADRAHPLLGNLRQTDFDFYRIWHSERAEACRRWVTTTRCSCTHECFLTASILFDKKNYPRLAMEWLKMKLKI